MGVGDRSRDKSNALTELRTVRSRAESAIDNLRGDTEYEVISARIVDDEYVDGYMHRFRDPDADEMIEVLQEFIEKTARFAKAGTRRSRNRGGF